MTHDDDDNQSLEDLASLLFDDPGFKSQFSMLNYDHAKEAYDAGKMPEAGRACLLSLVVAGDNEKAMDLYGRILSFEMDLFLENGMPEAALVAYWHGRNKVRDEDALLLKASRVPEELIETTLDKSDSELTALAIQYNMVYEERLFPCHTGPEKLTQWANEHMESFDAGSYKEALNYLNKIKSNFPGYIGTQGLIDRCQRQLDFLAFVKNE